VSQELRLCNKCKEHKPLSDFSKKKKGPGGFNWNCKACLSADYYAKLAEDPDRLEKNRQRQRNWRAANPDKVVVYSKHSIEWVKSNPEYTKQWYQKNKQLRDAMNTRWRKKNPHKVREYARQRRASKRGFGNFKILDKELKRLKQQPCFYCGSRENITIDHVIPLSRGGYDSIGNILPACLSCNSQKNSRFIMEYRTGKSAPRKAVKL
jgi:5-methylcytosine-specific restriction endonuclease McrA